MPAQGLEIDLRKIDQQARRFTGVQRRPLQARRNIRPARLEPWQDFVPQEIPVEALVGV